MKYFFLLITLTLNFHYGCSTNNESTAIKQSEQISKVWELEKHNWIVSSLFVYQQELFFGGMDNNFYCVDLESGKVKWEVKTEEECYPPPILSSDRVFFTSFDLFLYALSKNGKEIWRYELPGRVKSSPVFYSGTIIVSVKNEAILGIDGETGKLKWEVPIGMTNLSTTQPILSSDVLLVGNLDNTFSAINPENGMLIWKKSFENAILSSPSIYDSLVVFGGFNPIDTKKTFINAINIKTGNTVWNITMNYNARYSPLVHNGNIYIGTESSEIICLSGTDGTEIWKTKLDGDDGIGTEMMVWNNKLYFGSYNRKIYTINAFNGNPIDISSFQYGLSNPLFENGNVFFGTGDGFLYRITE